MEDPALKQMAGMYGMASMPAMTPEPGAEPAAFDESHFHPDNLRQRSQQQ